MLGEKVKGFNEIGETLADYLRRGVAFHARACIAKTPADIEPHRPLLPLLLSAHRECHGTMSGGPRAAGGYMRIVDYHSLY